MKKMIISSVLSLLLAADFVAAGKNVEKPDSGVVPVDAIPFYIGVGGMWSGVSRNCPCDNKRYKDSTYGEIVRIGYDFNPFFGIEARYLHANIDINFAETTHYGIYAKPQYHISPLVNVYALAGYGHTYIKCTKKGSLDYSHNGFSFGAGIEYDLSAGRGLQGDAEEGWGLFLDWHNLAHQTGTYKANVNIISAGITYDF